MTKNISAITRRELMQRAALSALFLSLPPLTGFSSIPRYRPIESSTGKALYLTHAEIIDVVKGTLLSNQTIAIRKGIIESISEQVPVAREGDLTLDLKNQYVLPGLIDAHCHATLPGGSALQAGLFLTIMNQLKRNYTQQLRQGVTTIRDMGALPKILHDHLAQIQTGELIGPRVVYCNAFTNIHGGHPDFNPQEMSIFAWLILAFTGRSNMWFQDTEELKEKMRQNSAGGASFIKLTMDKISVLCGKSEIPAYTDEHLKTICDFAQKNNLPIAGHIHTKFGFDRAVQYGINTMEHSISDAVLTPKDIEAMAKKKIANIPTMTIAQRLSAPEAYDELPKKFRTDFIEQEIALRRDYINSAPNDYTEPAIHKNNVVHLQNYKKYGCDDLYKMRKFMANPEIYFNILLLGPKNLLAMRDAGIIIGCGTDAGVPFAYHGTLWQEMEMLHRVGLSNKEVLRSATINNAKIVGMADKIGTIDVGKYADLVIFEENPLEKIEACRKPQTVVKDGKIYETEKIALKT